MKKFIYLLSIALAVIVSTANSWGQQTVPQQPVPYNEGFENYGSSDMPSGWNQITSNNNYYVEISGYAKHDGDFGIRFVSMSGTDADYIIAALPMFNVSLSNLEISFWYSSSASASGTFDFGYLTNENSFSSLMTLPKPTEWTQKTIDLAEIPEDANRLAFRFTGKSNYFYFYVDDIKVTTCHTPSSLNVEATGTTTATATWAAGGGDLNGNMSV